MAVLEAEGLLVTMSDDGVMMLTNLTIARGKTALPRPPPLEGPPVCLQRITDIQVIAFLQSPHMHWSCRPLRRCGPYTRLLGHLCLP